MKEHLKAMTGRCESLQHLCIRSVGQDDYRDYRYFARREHERYNEWALFIDAARLTLQSLVFEQGIEPVSLKQYYGGRHMLGRSVQVGRPMDAYFMEHIYPILLEGHWPNLKHISIMGVGGHRRYYILPYTPKDSTFFDVAEDRLRCARGREVSILWARAAGSSFDFSMDYEDCSYDLPDHELQHIFQKRIYDEGSFFL